MTLLLKRIIRSAWTNFYRNLGLSLVAVFAIVIALILITLIFAANDFSEMLVGDIKDKISISVYFKDGVDEVTILEVKEELLSMEETRSVQYTSKGEAFENFIERHKDNPVIMASLAEVGNPFLPSLVIRSGTGEGYEIIASYLDESPLRIFFEKIDYDQRKSIINTIFEITFLARKAGFISAIVLSLIAVLIVFNTVRLAIYGMREEIKMMRLVGVSNNFIRGMFVAQGMIVGMVSFLSAFLIIFGLGLFFGENIKTLIFGFDFFSYLKANFLFILLVQLLIGVGLGKVSSVAATAKYLR